MESRLLNSIGYCKTHRPDERGFVYVMVCEGFVKIGVATNIEDRLTTLQIGNPFEIKIIKAWRTTDPGQLEDRLHAILERYRVRGEWFKIPEEELEKLISYKYPGWYRKD